MFIATKPPKDQTAQMFPYYQYFSAECNGSALTLSPIYFIIPTTEFLRRDPRRLIEQLIRHWVLF